MVSSFVSRHRRGIPERRDSGRNALRGGGVLVLSGMVALVCLESLKLGGVVTRLSLITDGLSLGQFLTVFGDVSFD